jgi:DNA polymerase III subunit chi
MAAPPQVEFHTGVGDPVSFACRLLRKAYRQGARVAVTAASVTLHALDRALWTFDERDFVPHACVSDAQAERATVRLSPIWLLFGPLPQDHPGVLVNLDGNIDDIAGQFERVIEVVAAEPAEAERARARWRQYRGRGWVVRHHTAEAGGN